MKKITENNWHIAFVNMLIIILLFLLTYNAGLFAQDTLFQDEMKLTLPFNIKFIDQRKNLNSSLSTPNFTK